MTEFDEDTLRALQAVYKALLKLEGGMLKLATAAGGSVDADIRANNSIDTERHTLRNLDHRIWPPRKEKPAP